MRQNNPQDLQKLLGNRKAMENLSQSPEAKALINILSRGRSEASLQQIAQNAAKGNTAQLSELIRTITSTPDGAQLLQRLSRTIEEN